MFDSITNWLRNPGANMTAFGWFAIVGLVLISLLIWSRILRMIS
jgi:hypothetical protein